MRKLAVVFDVAGTLLRMYRVAKDLQNKIIIERVVTWELIMQKRGRALVVPQLDPSFILNSDPKTPLSAVCRGREEHIEISCSSSPVSRESAIDIIMASRACMGDLLDSHLAVRSKCPDLYLTTGIVVDCEMEDVTFIISTGGVPYKGLDLVLRDLWSMDAEIFVASGDSMRSLINLTAFGIDEDHIFSVSSPRRKERIVQDLKDRFHTVVMVGDGLNDIYAFKASDLGVLTMQQDTKPAPALIEASDLIIRDIRELPGQIRGRLLLHPPFI